MPFLRLLLPLIAGILCYYYNHSFVNEGAVFLLLLCLLATLVLTGALKQKYIAIKYLFAAAMHLSVFFSAFLFCFDNDIRNRANWFGKDVAADAYLVRISDQPAEKERTWKLEVNVINAISGSGEFSAVQGKAFLYVYKEEVPMRLQEGDTIMLPAKWQRIKNAGNPFEFDYAGYCARHNIYYQQFLNEDEIQVYGKGNAEDIGWVRQVHNACMGRLSRFVKDKATLGLIQAMLIGDEVNFDSELRQAYSETGIIHVVAISGSHIAFFFVFIAFLLGWIKNRKYYWLKYVIAIPLVWAYVLIAGAPPSAVRAAVMFTILGLGFALQKNPNSLNQLLATAFILLCAEPMWLFSVGFQLSFIAVLSLILFYRPVYKLLSPVHFIGRALWASVAASIAAEVLVAPLVIYYFHIFPLMFIVANVVAYLFMGVVLVAGMLIVAMPIPVVASAIGSITTLLVCLFNDIVFSLRRFNPQSFYFLGLQEYELLLVFIVISAIAIFLLKQQKAGLFTGLVALCLLMISFCVNEWETLHQRKLVVYNIARANHAELVEGKYHIVLASDSNISQRKKDYVLKPAHTGWHAWREKKNMLPEVLEIDGKSVLILNEMSAYDGEFPIDYLILNFNVKKTAPGYFMETFHPRKIILGPGVSRRKAEEWRDICGKQGIPLHNVLLSGAFVL